MLLEMTPSLEESEKGNNERDKGEGASDGVEDKGRGQRLRDNVGKAIKLAFVYELGQFKAPVTRKTLNVQGMRGGGIEFVTKLWCGAG